MRGYDALAIDDFREGGARHIERDDGLGNGQSQGFKVHRGKNFAGWAGIFMGKMYRVAQRGAIREPLPVPSFPDFWLGDNQPIYGRFASAPGVGEKCRSSTFIRGRFVNVWVGG